MATTTADKHYYVANVAPALLQRPSLSPNAKLVAIVLLMHYNRTSGLCYPMQDVIGAEVGLSERTVMRAIAELRQHGMIEREARSAPRGKAKGRANLYRLTGLLDLCSQPIRSASEVTKLVGHAKTEVTKTTPREVTKTTPHASDFRAITANSEETRYTAAASDHDSLSEVDDQTVPAPVWDGKAEPREAGEVTKTTPHSARIAQDGPLKGLSIGAIHEQRLAPNGESAFDVFADAEAWGEATYAIKAAGGEEFNPDALSKLIDDYGSELVWFQAKWFSRRLASRKNPPDRPTAYFVQSVRNDYPVNPTWPEYCRWYHGKLSDAQIADRPNEDASALELLRWMNRHDWTLLDFPERIRARLGDAVIHDPEAQAEMIAAATAAIEAFAPPAPDCNDELVEVPF
jgi:hypothetical protein